MQIFCLHKNLYKLNRFIAPEQNISKEFFVLQEKLKQWQLLKHKKLPDKEIAKIIGFSRATYYRYTKSIKLYGIKGIEKRSKRPKSFRKSNIATTVVDQILLLRKANPTYGKAKIAVLLKRDHGINLSESSVGRVLKKLIALKKILPSISATKPKRKRRFSTHAKPWNYNMKAKVVGEMIQIDHMSVTKNGITMKHFQAWDPMSKMIFAQVFSNAKSSTAKKFLQQLQDYLPFPVQSIQVDGGAEFMKDFEDQCQKLSIPLYVIPPRRPQYNGGVERGNRTFREEFYAKTDILSDSIGAFRLDLKHAIHKYNTYRPHFSLHGLTPLEYTKLFLEAS